MRTRAQLRVNVGLEATQSADGRTGEGESGGAETVGNTKANVSAASKLPGDGKVKKEPDAAGEQVSWPRQPVRTVKKEPVTDGESMVSSIADSIPSASQGPPAPRVKRIKREGGVVEAAGAPVGQRGPPHTEYDPGPFPYFSRPRPSEMQAAYDALAGLHGDPAADADAAAHHSQQSVLDSLVRTMLSQNTTDVTSLRAFQQLKAAFPTWQEVRDASQEEVADSIRCCGLADVRAARIQAILATLDGSPGGLSLEHLRRVSSDEAKKTLTGFKGVGPKTASCVCMFSLGHSDFPVDTHVWRISAAMGWCPYKASREQCYEHMNARVPPRLKRGLHLLLVRHGKTCSQCAKNGKNRFPELGPCPLRPRPSGKGRRGMAAA